MEQLNSVNQLSQNKVRVAREAELKKRKSNRQNQDKYWEINRIASDAAKLELHARNQAYKDLYVEIEFGKLCNGDKTAIDAFIDFLGVDVMASGCAYLKERGLHRLKRMPLTSRQIERLKQLALLQIERRGTGLTEFTHLMIRLADAGWIEALRQKSANCDNQTRCKAQRMLRVVLNSRKDLR